MITKLQPKCILNYHSDPFVPVTAQINLALHGTVAQETTYKNASNSYNATLAIEGPANNNWKDGCSSTEAQRMNDFRLYLANGSVYKTTELCFKDSAKQAYRNLNQSIDCHLSPTRNIYFFNRRTYVELCYIEIYDNTVYNGIVKYSLTGVSSPAHVLIDGNTTSCISIETASFESYIQVGNGSLIVITGMYLFFGDNTTIAGNHKVFCSNTTDSWADGVVLYNAEYDNEDIPVFAVCKYIIYIPPILYGNTKLDICEIEIGGCPYGKYGDNCQSTCPKNCNGFCDLDTGNCVLGCLDGWLGEKCETVNCLSPSCDHVTGQCKSGCFLTNEGFNCTDECNIGYFGWNCSETCNGCIADECNHINGICKNDSVCKTGYKYGKYCNQTCEDWHFGTNCNEMCNCLTISCNALTGKCPDGDCAKGWSGDSCDQDTQESQAGSGPAIGGSISGVIIVIVIVVLAVIIYRRRSTPQQDRFSSDNEALKRAEGNTYFNQEIIQKKEDGYANMGCATSVGDIQISLSGINAGKVRYSEENDQLPEEEEYSEEDEGGGVYTNIAAEQSKHKIPISELKKVISEKRKDDGFDNEYKVS
ncbi:MEGF10_11 [Mytilus edulis]|uniref:MEGF10_11 n=1 Tax=Mytilus edulis TaxID=6550 RepID=A0A8S3TFV8_MYTED|nr:MEGF10_11 [Mytilus edulis]